MSNSRTSSSVHCVTNYIFTITDEFVKNNYQTLPIKTLKVLLVKNDAEQWTFPSVETDSIPSSLNLHSYPFFKEDAVFHAESFAPSFTDNQQLSLNFLTFISSTTLEDAFIFNADEIGLFSISEVLSMLLPKKQKNIFFGVENASSLSDAGILSFFRKRILSSNLSKFFLPEEFTLAELFLVLKAVDPSFNTPKSNFITRLTNAKATVGLLNECVDSAGNEKKTKKYSQNPAKLYSFTDNPPTRTLSIFSTSF